MFPFLQKCIIHENNVLEYTYKNHKEKAGEGGGEMLTMADEGGRGVWGNAEND